MAHHSLEETAPDGKVLFEFSDLQQWPTWIHSIRHISHPSSYVVYKWHLTMRPVSISNTCGMT